MTDTGPPNAHFIQDVGIAHAVCGAGLIWCAGNLRVARPASLGITGFFAGHALGHAVEIVLGQLPPRALVDRFPAGVRAGDRFVLYGVTAALAETDRRLRAPFHE